MQSDPDFFTPPRLPPLNLDVASLEGGGHTPAEFFGKMHDGRAVYCRYRGGWLSVHVARKLGVAAYVEGDTMLEAHIGPWLHGFISLGQVCRYAGITIAGQFPPMPSEVVRGLIDLSGDTTFLDLRLESTEATARDIYDDIVDQFPDVIGAQQIQPGQGHFTIRRTSADAVGWRFLRLLRSVGSAGTLERGWPIEVVDVEGVGSRMVLGTISHGAYSPPFQGSCYHYDEELIVAAGQPIQFLRASGGLPADDLWLSLSFSNDDERGRQLATEIRRLVTERCPMKRIVAFNLSTGERIPELDQFRLLDLEILKWLNGDDRRWLTGYSDCRPKPPLHVGYRPEKV